MSRPSDPKKDPAYPTPINAVGSWSNAPEGLTQYAEVAARFHAALAVKAYQTSSQGAACTAFNHADAFFAELKRRTS